jgi:hypothetical protein
MTLKQAEQNGSIQRTLADALARLDPARAPAGFAALQRTTGISAPAMHWEP